MIASTKFAFLGQSAEISNISSDNGPLFTSNEFKLYMVEVKTKHPLWSQASSKTEILMKPLTMTIRAARIEKNDWKSYTHFYRIIEPSALN